MNTEQLVLLFTSPILNIGMATPYSINPAFNVFDKDIRHIPRDT